MKNRHRKRFVNNRRVVNVLRLDPTRTTMLRKAFVARLRRQFARLNLAMVDLIVREDALGLRERRRTIAQLMVGNAFCPTGEGGGVDPTCSTSASTGDGRVTGHMGEDTTLTGYRKYSLKIGNKLVGDVTVIDKGDGIVRTERLGIERGYRGKGHAKELYKQLFASLKSEGVQRVISGGSQSPGGKAVWESLARDLPIIERHAGSYSIDLNKLIANVFCPTGEGGGVDPSCGNEHSIGQDIGTERSEYAGTSGVAFPAAVGVKVPKLGKDEVYLVRYSTVDETKGGEGIGHFAYAGKHLDDVINATQSYAHNLGGGTTKGFLTIGRTSEPNWSHDLSAESSGIEHNGVLGKKGSKIDKVIDLSKPPTTNQRWRFETDPEKLKRFQEWLRRQLKLTVLSATDEELWERYVTEGYRKGAGRAFDDVRVAERAKYGAADKLDFYQGSREQFLKSAFGRPESAAKVKLIAERTYDELEGMTADMSLKLGRALADGLVQGSNPVEIARGLSKQLGLSRNRAEVIARTEIIRAHAEGQLNAMSDLGVEEVGVMVEWSTAGDDRVCEQCQPMEGVVLRIEEAKGMIPRHPSCRCSWVPANVGESTDDQKRGKARIERAVRVSAERANSDGFDTNVPVSRNRPQSVLNVFCPTGEGGGIDNSCGVGFGAGKSWDKEMGQKVVDHLGKEVQMIGSVSKKGKSDHDLDLLLKGTHPERGSSPRSDIKDKLEQLGFTYTGQSLMSPEEAAKGRKTFKKGKWSELHHFRSETGRKVEVWSILDVS